MKTFNYEVAVTFLSNRRSAYAPDFCRVIVNASDIDTAGAIAIQRERESLARLGIKGVRVIAGSIRNVSLYP